MFFPSFINILQHFSKRCCNIWLDPFWNSIQILCEIFFANFMMQNHHLLNFFGKLLKLVHYLSHILHKKCMIPTRTINWNLELCGKRKDRVARRQIYGNIKFLGKLFIFEIPSPQNTDSLKKRFPKDQEPKDRFIT